jgi:type IV pilus assembly protein PilC
MTEFSYVGTDKKGARVQSKITANSEAEAKTRLRFLGIKVIAISTGRLKVPGDISLSEILSRLTGGRIKQVGGPKVGVADVMVFTKQMATLIDAGIAIITSLDMLANQTSSPALRAMIDNVREQVEGGKDFASALAKHPKAFDTTYVSLIRAGAASGQLDVMMKKLTIYIEKASKLRKQLISAMSYPTIVLIIAILMTTGMLMFVVPMFAKNYIDSGKPLPELTQFVIDMSDWLKGNFHIVVGVVVVAVMLFKRWVSTPAGRRGFDQLLLKLPVFGPLISKIAVARFTSTMATLVSSGIALPEALRTCSAAAGNKIIEAEIMKLEDGVTKGRTLSECMAKSFVFPKMVSGMVGIGEQTGRLDHMLEKIAVIYEEDVEAALAAALKMVEPAMFIIIGGIVGFILIAMYLPIFDMASTVG